MNYSRVVLKSLAAVLIGTLTVLGPAEGRRGIAVACGLGLASPPYMDNSCGAAQSHRAIDWRHLAAMHAEPAIGNGSQSGSICVAVIPITTTFDNDLRRFYADELSGKSGYQLARPEQGYGNQDDPVSGTDADDQYPEGSAADAEKDVDVQDVYAQSAGGADQEDAYAEGSYDHEYEYGDSSAGQSDVDEESSADEFTYGYEYSYPEAKYGCMADTEEDFVDEAQQESAGDDRAEQSDADEMNQQADDSEMEEWESDLSADDSNDDQVDESGWDVGSDESRLDEQSDYADDEETEITAGMSDDLGGAAAASAAASDAHCGLTATGKTALGALVSLAVRSLDRLAIVARGISALSVRDLPWEALIRGGQKDAAAFHAEPGWQWFQR